MLLLYSDWKVILKKKPTNIFIFLFLPLLIIKEQKIHLSDFRKSVITQIHKGLAWSDAYGISTSEIKWRQWDTCGEAPRLCQLKISECVQSSPPLQPPMLIASQTSLHDYLLYFQFLCRNLRICLC